jgi:hypothetical protein
MDEILTEISDEASILASKRNLYRFFGYLRQWEAAEFYESSGLWRWWTPLPHPWFNGVLSQQPPTGDAKELINETLAYFNGKDRPVFTWWRPLKWKRASGTGCLERVVWVSPMTHPLWLPILAD